MKKVIVAMSGGVDSSVAALLARNAGLEPVGITLRMFPSDESGERDAERVARKLGIEWHSADYTESFARDVTAPFVRSYKTGETPNPCTLCNRTAKTKYLFDQMSRFGAEKIITGHYASVINENGAAYIGKAAYPEKDQSYYLCLVEPFHAGLLEFPLGKMKKEEIRRIALDAALPVADKPDSQEVCFLKGEDYRDFLRPFAAGWPKGNFLFRGRSLGPNRGAYRYTPGQRRGLEISHTEPLYVKRTDAKTGDVYLGEKKEVFARGVKLRECSFYPDAPLIAGVKAKLRYRMAEEPCLMERAPEGKASLLFDRGQFAPAPGQTAAIYDGEKIIGGGVIDGVF